MKISRDNFHKFLPDTDIKSFVIKPVDETKIKIIVLSLSRLKAVGPSSIPTKILKLLSNDISSQLSELFNFCFSLAVFLSVLEFIKGFLIF